MYKKIDKVFMRITGILSLLTYVGFIGIMLLITADVALRKCTGAGILGTYEIVQYTLMAAVFAGFAYTQSLKGHVKVTMFLTMMPAKLRLVLVALTGLLSSATSFFVTWAAIQQALYSMASGTKTGVLGIPFYPFFWVEVVGMAVYGIVLLWDAIKGFMALGNQEIEKEYDTTLI